MLTLPIVVGKSYVRRDGVVVVAKAPYDASQNKQTVWVGVGDASINYPGHVLATTGKAGGGLNPLEFPFDLIADAEEKPAGHPHAANILLYAQDWVETETPWTRWEVQFQNNSWRSFIGHPEWKGHYQYRRKPSTIKIGDCEIQAPERVAPAVGSKYWVPIISISDQLFDDFTWDGCTVDIRCLERGFIHLTKEAAEAHAKALIALTAIK